LQASNRRGGRVVECT